MNIFVTDPDPQVCATALDDKRLVKMVLETAQLLCTAVIHCGVDEGRLYKATHANHPCSLWARETRENFYWLTQHGIYLSNEYSMRFRKRHRSLLVIHLASDFGEYLPEGELTPFKNCTDFKDAPDVYQAYRHALSSKWANDAANGRFPKWTNAKRPEWSDAAQPAGGS